MEDRFHIENSGTPYFQFQTEAHILDRENEGHTIIVRSGYCQLGPTDEYAEQILKILNDGFSTK